MKRNKKKQYNVQHYSELNVIKVMRIFETFRPNNELLRKYVSYYYLDIADDPSYFNEYICYPHYNTTVSFYKSHIASLNSQHSVVQYCEGANPLQIFTPLRETPLKVSQKGAVHKIAIVFEPLGINQFMGHLDLLERQVSPTFQLFDAKEVEQLFEQAIPGQIADLLDSFLLANFKQVQNNYVSEAIAQFHQSENNLLIDEIAENKLGIGRKQLNRLFKQYLGTSPQNYRSIVRFRQLMAYKLGQEGQKNYTSLSHQVHYTDQSHFIKACKQLTGLTPSQFFRDGKIVGSEDTFWKFTG